MASNRQQATNTYALLIAVNYINADPKYVKITDYAILTACKEALLSSPNPTDPELIQYKEVIINYMLKRIRELCDEGIRELDSQKAIEKFDTAISWLNPINHEQYGKDDKNRLLASICHNHALRYFDQDKSELALQACKNAKLVMELICKKSEEDYLDPIKTDHLEADIYFRQLKYPDAKKAFSKVLKNLLEAVKNYPNKPLSDQFYIMLSDAQHAISSLCCDLRDISGMRDQAIQYAEDALYSIEKVENKDATIINKHGDIQDRLRILQRTLAIVTKPSKPEEKQIMQELQRHNKEIKRQIKRHEKLVTLRALMTIHAEYLEYTTSTPAFFSPTSSSRSRSSTSSSNSISPSPTATTAESSPVSVQGLGRGGLL